MIFQSGYLATTPLKKAKVFEDFNQYLQYEIIELQKLMGDVDFADADEELDYHKKYLGGRILIMVCGRWSFCNVVFYQKK